MRTAEQKPTDRLIVALDYAGWAEAEQLVQLLPEVEYFKVGLELYLASRGEAVARLREMGKKVFLDLKFHDIPNTVARASAQAVEQGATIFNVHAGGGRRMMEQAAQTAREKTKESGSAAPLVIAVTVLTSFDEAGLREVGLEGIEKTVVNYARLAEECGLDGVVASPREISLIRAHCRPDFKIICPGVRPVWAAANDQKRITTPKEAVKLGADYLVVGRPITAAADPREAALKVLDEIEEALA
ncbi:MAG TPA: orotidine-5'-phosphate decarboxylase [Peptococcaceae bacterium]|jgi:orotidine-5'-phosphate decarboxylase|nr:orotidine-5'-phosphate decarboxylase [Clostridia bacterium]HOB82443.1 orotidine-5'-phosphate decarboxylase [Peptococcaceae bacterium]HPZ70825.1 orotidine-5'-phosphate decarboxylase [Peptococcaceae bacterium]HQD53515.1 orotidine-5'-phosphate decarboxylase [Peptococcaceae bacterium]